MALPPVGFHFWFLSGWRHLGFNREEGNELVRDCQIFIESGRKQLMINLDKWTRNLTEKKWHLDFQSYLSKEFSIGMTLPFDFFSDIDKLVGPVAE